MQINTNSIESVLYIPYKTSAQGRLPRVTSFKQLTGSSLQGNNSAMQALHIEQQSTSFYYSVHGHLCLLFFSGISSNSRELMILQACPVATLDVSSWAPAVSRWLDDRLNGRQPGGRQL